MRTLEFYNKLNKEQAILNGEKKEKTLEYIESLIQLKFDLPLVLKFLSLRCQMDGGIKKKTFDVIRREILHIYGFKHFSTLEKLRKAKLIYEAEEGGTKFEKIQDQFKLLNTNVKSDETKPTEISYVYSGHGPIICRLVEESLMKKSWK